MQGSQERSPSYYALLGGFIVCATLSFFFLNRAIATVSLGTAYAVWTGIGTLGTVLVGIVFFQDPLTAIRGVLLLTLLGSIIGLKSFA